MTHKGVLICTCIEVGAGASEHLLLYCPIWGDRVRSASWHVRESRFWNPRRFFGADLEISEIFSNRIWNPEL